MRICVVRTGPLESIFALFSGCLYFPFMSVDVLQILALASAPLQDQTSGEIPLP